MIRLQRERVGAMNSLVTTTRNGNILWLKQYICCRLIWLLTPPPFTPSPARLARDSRICRKRKRSCSCYDDSKKTVGLFRYNSCTLLQHRSDLGSVEMTHENFLCHSFTKVCLILQKIKENFVISILLFCMARLLTKL
jgi:hypothetical protein